MSEKIIDLAEGLRQSLPLLDPKDPYKIAGVLLQHRRVSEAGLGKLIYWRGTFWEFRGAAYREIEPDALRCWIWDALGRAKKSGQDGASVPFKPTKAGVDNVCDALKAHCLLDAGREPPCWIDHVEGRPSPDALLPVANGLLNLTSGELFPPDPGLFVTSASPVAYDPGVGPPHELLRFLGSVWPNDPEAIGTLQEFMGYYLSSDTRQQKILLVVGPPRSGKGTIARVLTALLGQESVASPTLASFATNFGLQDLIGKPLAIISDARIGGRTDQSIVVERLLTISGEDSLTIDRKYKAPWTGRLPTRLMIMTNELPRLADASSALTRRFIVLPMERSFLGREDHDLFDRLASELPAVLEWSRQGLLRLWGRGRLIQPASGESMIESLEVLAAPVAAFVDEWCIVQPGAEVSTADLFRSYRTWAELNGRRELNSATLGRNLRAYLPAIDDKKARTADGQREHRYVGIALRPGAPGVFGPGMVQAGSR